MVRVSAFGVMLPHWFVMNAVGVAPVLLLMSTILYFSRTFLIRYLTNAMMLHPLLFDNTFVSTVSILGSTSPYPAIYSSFSIDRHFLISESSEIRTPYRKTRY